jgi:hypothetical protein
MAVAHICKQEKKMKILIFFENFSNFQKYSKFAFVLLFTDMCYGHDEDIKSYFLTSRNPNKQKTSQNNAYKILEMKVKND